MPKLPTFQANVGDLPISGGRRATAEDFGGDIGKALGSVNTAVRQVHAAMEDSESRTAIIESSAIRAKYAKRLDEAALSNGDLEKLKQDMNDELSKVGESFATRRGQDSLALHTSNTNLMYDQQANAIAVRRARAEATLGAGRLLRNESVLIQGNLSYLAVAEQNAEEYVATLRTDPEHKANIVEMLKNNYNVTAAVQLARTDPEAKAKLEAGAFDLKPEQRLQAIHEADRAANARLVDEARVREEKRRMLNERDDEARDKTFKGIMTGNVSAREILNNPDFLPATREHMMNVLKARVEETRGGAKKSDPIVQKDLWLRIHAPDTDPRKIFTGDEIFKAVERGALNTTDANALNVLVANQKDENNRTFSMRLREQMMIVSRTMNDSAEYKNQPDVSAAIQMSLIAQVEKRALEMRQENKSPDTLLDPDSKDYFFKPGILKSTADGVKAAETAQLPRIETQADYDALAPGTPYVDSRGVRGVKKGKQVVESDLVQQIPR